MRTITAGLFLLLLRKTPQNLVQRLLDVRDAKIAYTVTRVSTAVTVLIARVVEIAAVAICAEAVLIVAFVATAVTLNEEIPPSSVAIVTIFKTQSMPAMLKPQTNCRATIQEIK